MKFLLGDFAAGIAESGSEHITKTRERNEKLINAGIERAMSRGTELYKERRVKAKELQERMGWLEHRNLANTPEQTAVLAGLGAVDWENLQRTITEAEVTGKPLTPTDLFPDAEVDALALDVNTDAQVNQALPASATSEFTSAQETQVRASLKDLFIRGSMAGGVLAPSPSYLQSRVETEAAALMPEVESAEQLRWLLSQEDVPPDIDTLGFKMPTSRIQELRLLELEAAQAARNAAPGEEAIYTPIQLWNFRDDISDSVQELSFGAEVDETTGVRMYVGQVDPNVLANIGHEVAMSIGQIISPMNMVLPEKKNQQVANISEKINNARPILTTIEFNEYLRRTVNIKNHANITEANLTAAGAEEQEIEDIMSAGGLGLQEVRFGQSGRHGAILSLAMLLNTDDKFLDPSRSNTSPTPITKEYLIRYYRAIIAESIPVDGLTSEQIVLAFTSNEEIDMTDPFTSIGSIITQVHNP